MRRKGFTLIELIVVMAILAILVMLAVPAFLKYTRKAEWIRIIHDARLVEDAAEEYYLEHEEYPIDTDNPKKGSELENPHDSKGNPYTPDPDKDYYPIDEDKIDDYVKVKDPDDYYLDPDTGDVIIEKPGDGTSKTPAPTPDNPGDEVGEVDSTHIWEIENSTAELMTGLSLAWENGDKIRLEVKAAWMNLIAMERQWEPEILERDGFDLSIQITEESGDRYPLTVSLGLRGDGSDKLTSEEYFNSEEITPGEGRSYQFYKRYMAYEQFAKVYSHEIVIPDDCNLEEALNTIIRFCGGNTYYQSYYSGDSAMWVYYIRVYKNNDIIYEQDFDGDTSDVWYPQIFKSYANHPWIGRSYTQGTPVWEIINADSAMVSGETYSIQWNRGDTLKLEVEAAWSNLFEYDTFDATVMINSSDGWNSYLYEVLLLQGGGDVMEEEDTPYYKVYTARSSGVQKFVLERVINTDLPAGLLQTAVSFSGSNTGWSFMHPGESSGMWIYGIKIYKNGELAYEERFGNANPKCFVPYSLTPWDK
jgi:prepilin-type N-terminal cleavage/methylation domain-containing protein